MHSAYLLRRIILVLALVVLVVASVLYGIRRIQRRQRRALEDVVRDLSRLALLRYVQLHRRCSEEVAYQRIAAFVKRHIWPDEWSTADSLLAQDRQGLLAYAQSILMDNPDEIDEI